MPINKPKSTGNPIAGGVIVPSTTPRVLAKNSLLTDDLRIEGDAALIAANIKSGVNIFGVAGSLSPSGGGGGGGASIQTFDVASNTTVEHRPTATLPDTITFEIPLHPNAPSLILRLKNNRLIIMPMADFLATRGTPFLYSGGSIQLLFQGGSWLVKSICTTHKLNNFLNEVLTLDP